ncbi:extracellular solute-binding protein [Methylobacterium sp.]|uniref:extracellular solute-binding protein n=1 Tax=Methylobacterium sp. TaxID=409 RepID=UPI00258E05AD|nr:extracellular solute-binding protein [Methylobacterium sp.]
MRHRSAITGLVLTLMAGWLSAPVAASERTRLTVYTALEPEQHGPVKAAIEAAVPEVEIAWVWDQTGVITDRVLEERREPRADMVLGLAATSLQLFKKADLLLPYRPAGAEALRPPFRDAGPAYAWTGMDAYLGVVCFNTALGERQRLSPPVFWRDLLGPALKGRIAMPNPAYTGTGYLLVAGWLQAMGEAAGWAFMDALHENVAAYLPVAATPCEEAARGTVAVGLTYDMRAAEIRARGAPIRILVPADGVGWELEAFAILASSPHRALAQRVADWAASREANALYAQTFAVVAHPGAARLPANYPPHAEARMIRNDLAWMAENRPRILAEWTRRYGAKAVHPPEPR